MDTKKLIEEVLADLGNNKPLTEVSSKIQIIVRLLGDDSLKSWYNCEFVTGYHNEELPQYRISQAAEIKADYLESRGFDILSIKGQNVPVANLGFDKYTQIMTIKFKDTISSIIEYSKHPSEVSMSLSPYEQVIVQKVLGQVQIQSVHKVIPPSVFQTIIDNVQGRIIDLFIDLDEKVFNGELDIHSGEAKKEIQQVITNNITAAIVQTGSGTINAQNSTIAANNETAINDETKQKLNALVDQIEQIVKDNDEEFNDIAQEIVDIRLELQSASPQPKILNRAFKALSWGTSTACKTLIEELVEKAVGLL